MITFFKVYINIINDTHNIKNISIHIFLKKLSSLKNKNQKIILYNVDRDDFNVCITDASKYKKA